MAGDYDSSLPVRTEANGDVVSKIVDSAGTNILAVNSNGRIGTTLRDATTDSSVLTITSNGRLGALIVDPTTNSSILGVSSSGRIGTTIRDASTDSNVLGVSSSGRIGTVIHDGSSDAQLWKINASGFGQVDIAAQSLAAVKVSKDANANSFSNPIYVSVTDAAGGMNVCSYDSTSKGAGLSATHTYTVTAGKTLFLKQVIASASGKMKVEIQTDQGVTPTPTTVAVGFVSTSDPNMDYIFAQPIEVGATLNVKVIKTNDDKSAMNLYSTIIGEEV